MRARWASESRVSATGRREISRSLALRIQRRRSLAGALMLVALVTSLIVACSDDDSTNNNNEPGVCGAGWVLIPEGAFTMGIEPDDPRLEPLGFTLHDIAAITVQMSGYCIERTEVSVAAYRECVEAGVCEVPDHVTSPGNYACNYSSEPGELERHPVNCLSWDKARQYCQAWQSGDLPSEAQWEKAARGTDARLFPWGDELPDCNRANYDENGDWNEDTDEGAGYGCAHSWAPITWEVGHLTSGKGDSPYGLKDMAGNVGEYTVDCFDPGMYQRCSEQECKDPVNFDPVYFEEVEGVCTHFLRGSSAGAIPEALISVIGGGGAWTTGDPDSGFRCVKPRP